MFLCIRPEIIMYLRKKFGGGVQCVLTANFVGKVCYCYYKLRARWGRWHVDSVAALEIKLKDGWETSIWDCVASGKIPLRYSCENTYSDCNLAFCI